MEAKKPVTNKRKSYLFMKGLYKDYHDNPEAMSFLHKLGNKAKKSGKMQRKLAR